MSTRPLVIYHANCVDGFSAAWCFWRQWRDAADYHAAHYGEQPPDVSGRRVFLVDFSYERETLLQMAAQAECVVVLDHHKTAADALAGLPTFETPGPGDEAGEDHIYGLLATLAFEGPVLAVCLDMDRSGSTLAWDFLFPDEPRPLLLGHIEDRDLWRFKLPHTREIQSAVFSHEYSFETWDALMAADQVELLKLTAAGAAIDRKHQKDIRELLGTCLRSMEIGGHLVPVASMPATMASDAGHVMSEGHPFAACYWDTPTTRQFSLRSRPEGLDVALIAQQYGGGGHQHAAGFRVPRNHPLAQA